MSIKELLWPSSGQDLSASTARDTGLILVIKAIIYYCGFKMYNCILVFKIMTYINVFCFLTVVDFVFPLSDPK